MSGAIPLLRLYALMDWTGATSEDFNAIKKVRLFTAYVKEYDIHISTSRM